MTKLQVATISAEPGQKAHGYGYANVGIASVRLPVTLINGARPGPRLALTSGVHYGEFIGIEALRRLLGEIDPLELSGQVVACPIACPPAFYAHRSAASPLDGINPNRVYPGSVTGRPTERMVAWVFDNIMSGADVFVDLHSGNISEDLDSFAAYRLSGNEELDLRAEELAGLFGVSVLCGGEPTGGNSHAAATRAGIVSLLVEVGGRGSRSPKEVRLVLDGLLRVMKRLGMIAMAPEMPDPPVQCWRLLGEVEAPMEGLWYPEFEVGEEVEAGRLLGRVVDPHGGVLAEISAPQAGKVLYGERGLSIACGDVIAAMAACDA